MYRVLKDAAVRQDKQSAKICLLASILYSLHTVIVCMLAACSAGQLRALSAAVQLLYIYGCAQPRYMKINIINLPTLPPPRTPAVRMQLVASKNSGGPLMGVMFWNGAMGSGTDDG
jgi:hypothetical protein